MSDTELFTQKIKDELQPLGYEIYPLGLTLVRGVTPDGWVYDNADGRLVLEAMYNHCQAKKRLDAMEALLTDMIAYADSPLPETPLGMNALWAMGSANLMAFTQRAKKILGKE